MPNQNYLKIAAIVIFLLLIFDVLIILHINGFEPTITSRNVTGEVIKGIMEMAK